MDNLGERLNGALRGENQASIRAVRATKYLAALDIGAQVAQAGLLKLMLEYWDEARRKSAMITTGVGGSEEFLVCVGGGGFRFEEQDGHRGAGIGRGSW